MILDEGGAKREVYLENWRERPMFANAPANHPAAAVMIMNDPLSQQAEIRTLVAAGFTNAAQVGKADPEELYKAVMQANADARFYKGKVGLRDIKRLIAAAAFAS